MHTRVLCLWCPNPDSAEGETRLTSQTEFIRNALCVRRVPSGGSDSGSCCANGVVSRGYCCS